MFYRSCSRAARSVSCGTNTCGNLRSTAVTAYPPPFRRRESVGAGNVKTAYVRISRPPIAIVRRPGSCHTAPRSRTHPLRPRHELGVCTPAEKLTLELAACPTPSIGPGRRMCGDDRAEVGLSNAPHCRNFPKVQQAAIGHEVVVGVDPGAVSLLTSRQIGFGSRRKSSRQTRTSHSPGWYLFSVASAPSCRCQRGRRFAPSLDV